MKTMVQQTVSMPEHQNIKTQYGTITALEWLKREKIRIEAAPGRRATIRKMGKTKQGMMYALWVDDIAGVSDPDYYENRKSLRVG